MDELVRVRIGKAELNFSRVIAEEEGLTILKDEPVLKPDGTYRPETRRGGRASKPQTTVASAAASKKRGGQSTPNAEEAPA